jgi:hypothetical protein
MEARSEDAHERFMRINWRWGGTFLVVWGRSNRSTTAAYIGISPLVSRHPAVVEGAIPTTAGDATNESKVGQRTTN